MLRYVHTLLKTTPMARSVPQKPLIVVLGATGTGKSQLAVELAKRFNGEIINGDAMQMYHGLPIVTNKITSEEQEGIPHHLLGFVGLGEEPWRITMFKKKATEVIKEIRSRGRLPILVGGTHYYTQSLLFKGSTIDSEEDSEQENTPSKLDSTTFPILNESTEIMYEQLKLVDPVMASRWHPKDHRKIRRSLEIYLQTGRKASDIYAEQKQQRLETSSQEPREEVVTDSDLELASTLLFWVHAEKDVLNSRLDARIEKMLAAGLLDEVLTMNAFVEEQKQNGSVVDVTRGIWVSIGWKEFEPYLRALQSGASPEEVQKALEESVERTQIATRQYAKRQVRWIRLKLLTGLREEGFQKHLYLLNGTGISKWSDHVSNPAVDIADAFLKGLDMPAPTELSAAATEHLSLDAVQSKDMDFIPRRECDICNSTVDGNQWEIHLKSRRHRSLIKKQGKKAGHENYLKQRENTVTTDKSP